jgi:predicted metal-binding protein
MNQLETLIQDALKSGVTEAVVISTGDITVDQKLADMCREPRCECYGLSMSCPPHVAGPAGFRKLLEKFSRAVFFKIDVPSEFLFSSERGEIFQLLHELAAGIEQQAVKMGFSEARAYAGGSCKQIFCHDHPDCRVLSGKGTCRNPRTARPSMSGFGVDVAGLIQTAGWKERLAASDTAPPDARMTPVYGLVLID